ncbi:protein TIFY 10a [Trifolium repens]|nr:protein TIFY 10a [Trifolium repens]
MKGVMTIFYFGKVIVLDDIPDEKAKDIMVFSTDNYAAYPSFLARNSANNFVQVPSTVPVIYGKLHFIGSWRKGRIGLLLGHYINQLIQQQPLIRHLMNHGMALLDTTITTTQCYLN